ncbi:MAG: iron-containing alcohol dehydrogenase [Actinobacteria bacterium]|jgi:hydroxyacid-oxoacid transhydrogenase|nr:iron-containing alcohol dehydrogenase [Actinomycetota bacterium]
MEVDVTLETVFSMDASSIKFGKGATREVGSDMKALGAKRVMVVTDTNLVTSEPVAVALDSLKKEGIDTTLFDRVRVEPNDQSFQEAVAFAVEGGFDGYVAVGGGSTMDTAKVANLYATYPADFLDYVNAPIGKAKPVPGDLKPLVAIPTTAGTGSETTGVAIFDLSEMHAKTGIAHKALRPRLGIVDPENTRTLPKMAVACTALDVFSHAIESLTALPFHKREAPDSPTMRPAYQGANPISNIWAAKALEIGSKFMIRAVNDPDDEEARTQMILASTIAGVGFGSAGVTLPHGMSYPISGLVRDYRPDGYPQDHALVPHGMAVILGAPAAFRFMAPGNPDMFLRAAELIGVDTRGAGPGDVGEMVAQAVIEIMQKVGIPNGLRAVGYTPDDVDALVEGVLPQQRVTKLSPRPATAADFRQMFLDSMTIW